MYQQGLVSNDETLQNFLTNQEYMPNPPTDKRDVIAFRKWNAASWVRPMYFLSLLIMACVLIVNFISFVDTGSGGIIFFGVVVIVLCCGACLIFHRIVYELVMAFLQIPKLIASMERLADTVDRTTTQNNGPQVPIMTTVTTGYQTGYQGNQHHE